ncbi:uncharacterized protein [Parasteatoda tepidariorum]|uniref:uncharacterized protein n=1 Tax=Parasteatoda tepidariorum TaxID=114398 RepID=UPI00077FC047|nr:uncharacterized protein LOC107456502 [Parasteatoda tepidariorum]
MFVHLTATFLLLLSCGTFCFADVRNSTLLHNENNFNQRQLLNDTTTETRVASDEFSYDDEEIRDANKHSKSLLESKKLFRTFLTNEQRLRKNLQETARQFVPYLQKEVDEKLSVHDVLPVKMVKFIKSMVEDAPWEAMFMKMVRMVVDQFVDKIIEKMFAGKDEEDKWRSADGSFEFNPSELPILTSVERMRRSADFSKVSKDGNGLPSMNQLKKEAGELENDNWLDLFLEYVFPGGEEKVDERANHKLALKSRHKRDGEHFEEKENGIDLSSLLDKDLFDGMQNFVLTVKVRQALKDFIKYRILKRVLRPLREINDPNYLLSSHRNKPSFLRGQKYQANFIRRKRSINGNQKPSTKDHSERLWHHGVRSSHFKRDDCSLRRACNAGRLLSRLPSVEDITLQLKSHHHEPHWDALLWGLKKKKCSRIFCKRQRSPKGSKNDWNLSGKRQNRKIHLTSLPTDDDAIIPF